MWFICLTIKGHIQQRFNRSADNKALMTFYELAWNNSLKKLENVNFSSACTWLLFSWPWLQLVGFRQLKIQTSPVPQLRLRGSGKSVQDSQIGQCNHLALVGTEVSIFENASCFFGCTNTDVVKKSDFQMRRAQQFGKTNCFDTSPGGTPENSDHPDVFWKWEEKTKLTSLLVLWVQ